MGQAQVIHAGRLYRTTLLAKVAMGVSGIILLLFVLGHMVGNLQVFAGREALNNYAQTLRNLGGALWVVRLGLLAAVGIHIYSAFTLMQLNNAARPAPYAVVKPKRSTFASRTMVWTGPLILLYLVYHLWAFTIEPARKGGPPTPYEHVIAAFRNPWLALLYIAANLALAVHLWHGVWALFQSLGWSHPRYDPWRRAFASGFTLVVAIGFISVPVAVLFRIVS